MTAVLLHITRKKELKLWIPEIMPILHSHSKKRSLSANNLNELFLDKVVIKMGFDECTEVNLL